MDVRECATDRRVRKLGFNDSENEQPKKDNQSINKELNASDVNMSRHPSTPFVALQVHDLATTNVERPFTPFISAPIFSQIFTPDLQAKARNFNVQPMPLVTIA